MMLRRVFVCLVPPRRSRRPNEAEKLIAELAGCVD